MKHLSHWKLSVFGFLVRNDPNVIPAFAEIQLGGVRIPAFAGMKIAILVATCIIATLLGACTPLIAEGSPTPTPNATPVALAGASENRVTKFDRFAREAEMAAPETTDLFVGEGIAVDEQGQARLTFLQDLLTVEVLRQGELHVKETSLTGNETLLTLYQGVGVLFNDFDSSQAIGARLDVDTDFSRVTVRGTQFLVIREAHTPLEWIVVLEGHENAVLVTANGTTTAVTTNQAVWVAPIGPPGPVVAVDGAVVQAWLAAVRRGDPVAEIGEVVWARATGEVTSDLPNPLLIDTPFMYGDVEIRLDPRGRYERMDCNSDGRADIWLENGRLLLDLRQIQNRVRDVQVVVRNDGAAGTAVFTGFNPEGRVHPIAQAVAAQGSGATETLVLASQQEPFHFADLEMASGCFLGLDLTPTQDDATPLPGATTVTPGLQPEPAEPMTPTFTPTPVAEIRPFAGCVVAPPPGWVLYTVQPGNTLFSLAGRTAAGVAQVKQVNCLTSDNLQTGQQLWLPQSPIVTTPPTPTFTPTPSPTPTATPPSPTPTPTDEPETVQPPTLLAPLADAAFICGPNQEIVEVTLAWQPNNTAELIASYELRLALFGARGIALTPSFVPTSQTNHILPLPCSVTRVEWQVRAMTVNEQWGDWSEQRPFTLTRDLTPPTVPQPVSPNGEVIECEWGGEVMVRLDWETAVDQSPIDRYTVIVTPGNTGITQASKSQTVSGSQTELLWPLPCIGITYGWAVQATDLFGQSSDISPLLPFTVRAIDTTPPPAPQTLSPGDLAWDTPSYAVCPPSLSWEPVGDISKIRVYLVTSEMYITSWQSVIEGETTATSYMLDVGSYYPYRWRVAAVDGAGNVGEPSPWRYFNCPPNG